MFCGTRSFSRVDDDGCGRSPATWSRCSSKKKTTTIYGEEEKKKKNPYSARGLDKFYSLLDDLDARKRNITMTLDDSLQAIWFVYSSPHEWVPLVVKLHEPSRRSARKEKKNGRTKRSRSCGESAEHRWEASRGTNAAAGGTTPLALAAVEEKKVVGEEEEEKEERGRSEAGRHYLFWSVWVALGLILLCLATFGKSFAVFCTVLWWYLAPIDDMSGTGGGNGGARRRTKAVRRNERRTMRWL